MAQIPRSACPIFRVEITCRRQIILIADAKLLPLGCKRLRWLRILYIIRAIKRPAAPFVGASEASFGVTILTHERFPTQTKYDSAENCSVRGIPQASRGFVVVQLV